MGYKVIRPFKDLSDPKKHDYAIGDSFPRDGYEPSEEFTNGLLTGFNSAGSIFLAVDDVEETSENGEEESGTDEVPETGEEETPAEEEAEVTEEEVPAEKPKRKRTTKKAEA